MPSELLWQYSHLRGGMTGNCQRLLLINLGLAFLKIET